jgi:Zn-dependent protease with chaperone function
MALLLLPAQAFAQTQWDVEKLVTQSAALDPRAVVELRSGDSVTGARIEHLRNFLDAHKRLREVSKVGANLAIIVNKAPNAVADSRQRQIVVTTGMMELVGADPNMVAALLGHEHAHFSLRHGFERVLNAPRVINRAIGVMETVYQGTGNKEASIKTGQAAVGLLATSFSREQESEADRVGTELMGAAKYDPKGAIDLMTVMLKATGHAKTGYLDTHPGMEQRLANIAPAVAVQEFENVALQLVQKKSWRSLSRLADESLKANPESSRVWYYKGLALRGQSSTGALPAFEKAVANDGRFSKARLALCVELYRVGREMESVICSEHLPPGELYEQYEATTFKHGVYVSGTIPQQRISDRDWQIIKGVYGFSEKSSK